MQFQSMQGFQHLPNQIFLRGGCAPKAETISLFWLSYLPTRQGIAGPEELAKVAKQGKAWRVFGPITKSLTQRELGAQSSH